MTTLVRSILALAMTAAVALGLSQPASAQITAQQELVERSRLTLETLMIDPEFGDLRNYLVSARAVLIVPELVKAGFILGAEGGAGVLLVRGGDGVWSSPAFFTVAGASLGLQIGGQISQVVFTIMNANAVESILTNSFKLGVDASIAVGPLGKGLKASATSTELNQDVYGFAKTAGLFGGGAFDGTGFIERKTWNTAYYGPGATARAIVLERRFYNPNADTLRAKLPQ